MALLLHLSDLHLDPASASQPALLDKLVETLGREKARSPSAPVAMVVTGDVFDSATDAPADVVPLFLDLHARAVEALGCSVPTIVLPGNHDRRWRGLLGPHRSALFEGLRARVDPASIFVAGCRTPFLAEVVPEAFHGLPADVIAYDSTHLPHGLVSAGGIIRQEDLLQAHAELGGGSSDRPLLFLVHHHLIPTPLTDVSFIDGRSSMPRAARWLLGKALPTLVSNADREELTMTALGAGTALSTLHTFGRPVLLLHGHKHFPTARLVRGLVRGSGDVLIASAGSAGKRERIHATHDADAARLWPSFNVVRMEEDGVEIQAVSFAPKKSVRPPVHRDLARVTHRDARWEPSAASSRVRDATFKVARDEARFSLTPSETSRERYWDYACERRVELLPGVTLRRYVDFVHPGVRLENAAGRVGRRRIQLELNGVTRYAISNGLRRSASVAVRSRGVSEAFERVGLLSRYGGRVVTLSLARAGAGDLEPFGSETDLSTGRERPSPIEKLPDEWRLQVTDCPPRTLLRIYWPLPA
jgi:3',5'-cyclic AMP phosphodiesterase CpdA